MKQIIVPESNTTVSVDHVHYNDLVIVKKQDRIVGFIVYKNGFYRICFGINDCLEHGYQTIAGLIKNSHPDLEFYTNKG